MAPSLIAIYFSQLVFLLINDGTQKHRILKLLRPCWILHSKVELNELPLRRSHLVFLFISNEGNQTNILLRYFYTIWLWFIKFNFKD